MHRQWCPSTRPFPSLLDPARPCSAQSLPQAVRFGPEEGGIAKCASCIASKIWRVTAFTQRGADTDTDRQRVTGRYQGCGKGPLEKRSGGRKFYFGAPQVYCCSWKRPRSDEHGITRILSRSHRGRGGGGGVRPDLYSLKPVSRGGGGGRGGEGGGGGGVFLES